MIKAGATQTETSLLKQHAASERVDLLDDYDFPARTIIETTTTIPPPVSFKISPRLPLVILSNSFFYLFSLSHQTVPKTTNGAHKNGGARVLKCQIVSLTVSGIFPALLVQGCTVALASNQSPRDQTAIFKKKTNLKLN